LTLLHNLSSINEDSVILLTTSGEEKHSRKFSINSGIQRCMSSGTKAKNQALPEAITKPTSELTTPSNKPIIKMKHTQKHDKCLALDYLSALAPRDKTERFEMITKLYNQSPTNTATLQHTSQNNYKHLQKTTEITPHLLKKGQLPNSISFSRRLEYFVSC